MFAWLIDHTLIFLVIFFWGYFTIKLFYHGLWGILAGVFFAGVYYDVSKNDPAFLHDVIFFLGIADYKFDLRSKAAAYLGFSWHAGLSGVKQHLFDNLHTLKEKLNLKTEFLNRDSTSNQYNDQTDELNRERQRREQAEAKQRQYQEQARRAKEEAQRAKKNSSQQQSQKDSLDPTKLKDAYEILGVPYGADKEECKKAFKRLMQMYHPDKLAGFSGWRKKQMEKEAKRIGVAWETIKTS